MNLLTLIAFLILLTVPATLTCVVPRADAENKTYKRTIEKYAIPDVILIDQNGKKVRFNNLIESNKPVVVDFIFGTCTTICPVLSAGYANIQQKLGPDTQKIKLISISIDPENDSPKVMREYLKRYRAKPGWEFLTGSHADIDKIMRAFNAYIPNKMSHYPLTFIRMPSDGKWIRIFGLLSSSEFMSECQNAGLK